MKLSNAARHRIKPKNFALPGGRYPIEDRGHAEAALGEVAAHGTPSEKATVRRKVASRYGIGSSPTQ